MSSQDDIVTLTTPDGSDTITVTAEADWLPDITAGDSIKLGNYGGDDYFDDTCDTFTYTTKQFDEIKWDDIFTTAPEIRIGDSVITADMVDKLTALIDMIEGLDDDNALKELFNTQLGMNKIRGEHDNS